MATHVDIVCAYQGQRTELQEFKPPVDRYKLQGKKISEQKGRIAKQVDKAAADAKAKAEAIEQFSKKAFELI